MGRKDYNVCDDTHLCCGSRNRKSFRKTDGIHDEEQEKPQTGSEESHSTPMYIIGWVIFLWKDKMTFRDRCDWAFYRSVDFLLYFKKIGWNYIVSSVIICVVVPVIIYVELIYAIMNK